MINLRSLYFCKNCGNDEVSGKPNSKAECGECGSGDLLFETMVFYEKHLVDMGNGTEGYLAEVWRESAGIPICEFCRGRDFDSRDAIEEGWLVKEKNAAAFEYRCACSACRKEYGFDIVTRDELITSTDGLFAKGEKQAEERRKEQIAAFKAQYEVDLLNLGEQYVLEQYGYINTENDDD